MPELADALTPTLAALCGFAFLAGFIDAVVGGGGLIQLPALFVLMPETAPAVLLGTNKFAAIWGTASATLTYARRVAIDRQLVLPAGLAAAACSFAGARAASAMGDAALKPLLLVLMVAMLLYTLWKKDLGARHAPTLSSHRQALAGVVVGGAVDFYDGFFGPGTGTGSILIFAFVGLFGFSFLAASASAKAINTITNVAALGWFVSSDSVLYRCAIPMTAFNVAGALCGARLAMARGSGFVRLLFVVVVSALILRFGRDIIDG